MATTDVRLKWGQTDLFPVPRPIEDGGTLGLPYTIQASADGTNWGNPDAIITAVQSRLQDGSLAIVDSFGNREAPVFLRVVAGSYDGLGLGEAALVAESRAQGYNTLEWTPSEAFAVPTVFDVVYGLLTFDFDDYTETQLKRRFVARLTCLPFPRSATEVVARAVGTGETVVPVEANIADGSSTTGWTGYNHDLSENPGGAITVDTLDSYVRVRGAAPGSRDYITAALSQNIDLTTTPYVAIDWRSGNSGTFLLDELASATRTFPGAPFSQVTPFKHIVSGPAPRAGFTRSVFLAPAGTTTITNLRVRWTVPISLPHIQIDQVLRSNVALGVSNTRQLARNLTVAGAVRTQGRLAVEHESSALGEVLCYVYRSTPETSSYVPSLRPYLTAGEASTTNTHTISGAQNSFDTDATFTIPASALVAGNHRLMLSLLCDAATATGFNTPVTVVVDTLIGGVVIPGSQTYTETVYVAAGLEPTSVDVCGLTLPTTLLANTSGATVRIRAHASDLDSAGGYHGIFFDEGWVFNLDIGTLTHVDCGTGTPSPGGPSKRLWLDPATVTNDGQDAIFRGHSADRSDAFSPADGIKGWTPPVFEPGEVTVFTVTTKAENAAVSLAYFPRFLHNAYDIPVDENGELITDQAA